MTYDAQAGRATDESSDRPSAADASFSELVEDFGSSSPTESTIHGLLRD